MAGIRVKGIKPVIKGFDKRIQFISIGDSAIYTRIASEAFKDVMDHFENTSGRSGKWQPLAPSTIRGRRKGSSKPLQDTGRMRGSIKPQGFKDRAEVFTNVEYAPFHDKGTRTIPRREFLWLSSKTKDRIRIFVEKKLRDAE
jgi:phage gpG-like protein